MKTLIIFIESDEMNLDGIFYFSRARFSVTIERYH